MPKIKTLTVHNFRGIIESTIDLDGCSVVILGENGTGKSSFVDALEFYFSGTVSHLEGAQGISTARHAPHIRSSQGQTLVALTFDRPEVTLTRTLRNFAEVPEGLREYHSLGASAKFILRRKNLLDFILAQPGPRYEQLAAIIGVNDLDKVERAFVQVSDELESQVTTLKSKIETEERKLDELIGNTDHSDEGILSGLNRKLLELNQPVLQTLDDVEKRKIAIVSSSRSPEDTQKALDVKNGLVLAQGLLGDISFLINYKELWHETENLQADAAQVRELLFQEALNAARKIVIEYSELDYCPVCMQQIDRVELLNSLEQRIRKAGIIEQRSSAIKTMRDGLIAAIQSKIEQWEQLAAVVAALNLVWDTSQVEPYVSMLTKLSSALASEPFEMRLPAFDELDTNPAITTAVKYLEGLSTYLKAEQSKLEPTEQDRITVTVIDLLTRVIDSRKTLQDLQPKLRAKSAVYREMRSIYECFVNTKRDEIKNIYQDLEGHIKRYFAILHENEGYREIRLAVDESKRASTEIKMDFHDRSQEDPRAFNSEGHLDSLGLCVFLAFVKRFNMGFPIIVLDDVVSSIDSGHRQRICRLLFDEFPDVQFFITTHDYIWFEELRSLQKACGKEHQFKNLQILDWSLEDGPRLDKYKPRWERIREKLERGDKDGAASDTRKELEAFLLELSISLMTPIPLKRDGRYTVADLHDPVVARVKKLIPEYYKNNQTVFQNLQANGIFGNLLVHNNPRAANTSLDEVRSFVQAVQDFESVLTCSKCLQIPVYHRDAKVIRCRCNEGGILWLTKD